MVSYHSAFSIGGSPPSSRTTEKYSTALGYAGGPTIFFRRRLRERKSREISPTENISLASPQARVSSTIWQESCIQASDPEDIALATVSVATSSTPGRNTCFGETGLKIRPDSRFGDAMQDAKQLFFSRLPQMTKYFI